MQIGALFGEVSRGAETRKPGRPVVLEVAPNRSVTAQTEQLAEDLHRQRLAIRELRCEAPVPEPDSPDDPVKTVANPQIHSNQLRFSVHLEPFPIRFPGWGFGSD